MTRLGRDKPESGENKTAAIDAQMSEPRRAAGRLEAKVRQTPEDKRYHDPEKKQRAGKQPTASRPPRRETSRDGPTISKIEIPES
jgi:hypothetical protein